LVGGTGLGLSIAKWILDSHGGSVEVYTRKGHGSTFVIWLPVLSREPGKLDNGDKCDEDQDFSPEE
jgi:signal transduction histidine kinase